MFARHRILLTLTTAPLVALAGVFTLDLSRSADASPRPVADVAHQDRMDANVAGVYLGFPSSFTFVTPHTQNGLQQLPGKDFFVLFPNGLVRRNLPQGGLDQFDIEQDKKANPLNWGVYTASSTRLVIHWGKSTANFVAARGKDSFTYQSDRYLRLPEGSARLDGTYCRADGMDPQFRITFRFDGAFQENGIIGPYIALNNYKLPGEGTYRVKNHTLHLDYADGRRRQISCLTLPAEASKTQPNLLVLNTYELGRRAKTDPQTSLASDAILVKGDPPLTQTMADTATDYYGWLMDIQFSPDQRERAHRYIVEYWTAQNAKAIKNVVDILRHRESALREPRYVQESIRADRQRTIIPLWRKTTDDPLSVYLASIYDTQHKNIP